MVVCALYAPVAALGGGPKSVKLVWPNCGRPVFTWLGDSGYMFWWTGWTTTGGCRKDPEVALGW